MLEALGVEGSVWENLDEFCRVMYQARPFNLLFHLTLQTKLKHPLYITESANSPSRPFHVFCLDPTPPHCSPELPPSFKA